MCDLQPCSERASRFGPWPTSQEDLGSSPRSATGVQSTRPQAGCPRTLKSFKGLFWTAQHLASDNLLLFFSKVQVWQRGGPKGTMYPRQPFHCLNSVHLLYYSLPPSPSPIWAYCCRISRLPDCRENSLSNPILLGTNIPSKRIQHQALLSKTCFYSVAAIFPISDSRGKCSKL